MFGAINFYVIEAVFIAILFGGGAYEIQSWRYEKKIAEIKAEASKQREAAIQNAVQVEHEQAKKVQEALSASIDRETKITVAADTARHRVDGVRQQLNTINASMPAATVETCRETSSTVTDILGECIAKYQEMAREADELGNSARTLNDGWPK